MSKDTSESFVSGDTRIDVWGSCVSRDTIEFMRDRTVGTYVARQSAIVALAPATDLDIPFETLESEFQRKMLSGDMKSDVIDRINGNDASCVLFDLVDERRGVWQFPNGTYLTNSVEAYRTGIDHWGPKAGAYLIQFGTDAHFELWRRGFERVAQRVSGSGKPIILLDIDWAEVFEGQNPTRGIRRVVSNGVRRGLRATAYFIRSTIRKRSLASGMSALSHLSPTRGDELFKTARVANARYRRYMKVAEEFAAYTIRRSATDVRMNPDHKWGVGPYHYSDKDYQAICDDIYRFLLDS